MGSRTITVRDPNHPHNMMHHVGQLTKSAARKLSNKELDQLLEMRVAEEEREMVLAWPRHRKIKFIRDNAMCNFAQDYNEAVKKEKEESNDREPGKDN